METRQPVKVLIHERQ